MRLQKAWLIRSIKQCYTYRMTYKFIIGNDSSKPNSTISTHYLSKISAPHLSTTSPLKAFPLASNPQFKPSLRWFKTYSPPICSPLSTNIIPPCPGKLTNYKRNSPKPPFRRSLVKCFISMSIIYWNLRNTSLREKSMRLRKDIQDRSRSI